MDRIHRLARGSRMGCYRALWLVGCPYVHCVGDLVVSACGRCTFVVVSDNKIHEGEENMGDTVKTVLLGILVLVVLFVGAFGGVFTSTEKAQKIAHSQLSPQAELQGKTIFFVGWRGCDRYDNAMFLVEPYIGLNGETVENAVICAGWPFKGYTVRFR